MSASNDGREPIRELRPWETFEMFTSAAASAAALMLAQTSAEPAAMVVRAPEATLTAETLLEWHEDIAKASHVMCRRLLAPTERTRSTRRACVRATLEEAIANAKAPALQAVHAALPRSERYAPSLPRRRAALLAQAAWALAQTYAQAP